MQRPRRLRNPQRRMFLYHYLMWSKTRQSALCRVYSLYFLQVLSVTSPSVCLLLSLESAWISTGTTLGLIAVEEALAAQNAGAPMTYVSREKLMKDMQFRGAISDFHPVKEHILKADYDPLLLRSNVDDLYGDGNNFEACVLTFVQRRSCNQGHRHVQPLPCFARRPWFFTKSHD